MSRKGTTIFPAMSAVGWTIDKGTPTERSIPNALPERLNSLLGCGLCAGNLE